MDTRRGALGRFGIALVPVVAVVVAVVTVLNRLGVIPLRDLAATPQAVGDGHEWLLLTSAFVADRPAVPSIAGFMIVGLAALALSGSRVLWTAAIAGHLAATVAVYGALDAASYTVTRPDYGTSAVIAAWIGVIAYHVRARGRGLAPLGLCVATALVGWLFRPDLDILDTEHAVALAVGIGVAVWLPRLRPVQLPVLLARRGLLLHGGLLRLGSARRGG